MKAKHVKKKKSRLPAVGAVLLLLAGLGVMLYPTINDLYSRWLTQEDIAQYNQVMEAEAADYSDLWDAAEAYNRDLAETGVFGGSVGTEERQEVSGLLNPLGTGMMGYIDIPKIDVHLSIYQGIEESVLQAGAGYWLGTSLPTGGAGTHCVLTAHNGLVRAKMFTDLDQLEIGDTFSLSILDRVLTYEVDRILVTEPNDLEPLQIVPGEDLVTLYTCTPYGVNTHRLLVRGHRIATPEDPEPVTVMEVVSGGMSALEAAVWIALLVLSVLLILLALRALIRQAKAPPPKRLNTAPRRRLRDRRHFTDSDDTRK